MTNNDTYNHSKAQAVLLASQKRRGIVPQGAVKPLPVMTFDPKEENGPTETQPEDEHILAIRAGLSKVKSPQYIYTEVCAQLIAGFDIADKHTKKEKVRLTALKAKYEAKFPYFLNSREIKEAIYKRVWEMSGIKPSVPFEEYMSFIDSQEG